MNNTEGHLRSRLRDALVPHAGNEYHPHALRRRSLHLVGGVLIAVKLLAILLISSYAEDAHVISVSPDAIISETNRVRGKNRVAGLRSNSLLQQAARAKARDMASKGYFAHFSPSNVSPWYWFKKAGYVYAYAGENLAIDFASTEDVVAAWLASPSHRRNLLNTRFQEIGVATATGKINGVQSLVIVQLFGTRAKPAVKKTSTKSTQSPEPQTTRRVLAEETPTEKIEEVGIPPTAPRVVSPARGSVVRVAKPTIVGRADSGSVVIVRIGDREDGQAIVSSSGVFSYQLAAGLPEGSARIRLTARRHGLDSPSSTIEFAVDTLAPQIGIAESYVISDIENQRYHVFVSVPGDVAAVEAVSGTQVAKLQPLSGARYYGTVPISVRGALAGTVSIEVSDAAGNVGRQPLLTSERFATGVVAASGGPGIQALKVLFFSRTFFMTFLVLIFTIAALNVALNWQRRHHPALLGLLLLMYITGAMAFM